MHVQRYTMTGHWTTGSLNDEYRYWIHVHILYCLGTTGYRGFGGKCQGNEDIEILYTYEDNKENHI